MQFKLSITGLLIVPIIVLCVILGVSGSVVLNQLIDQNAQSLLDEESDRVHSQVENLVDSYFETAEIVLLIEAPYFSQIGNNLDINTVVSTLRVQIKQLPFADYLYFTSADGQIVSVGKNGNYAFSSADAPTEFRMYADVNATEPTRIRKDLDFRTKSWYIDATKTNAVVWTDPYPGEQVDTLAISASKQVVDSNGTLLGVIGMDMLLPELKSKIGSIKLTDGGFLYISADSQLISSNQGQQDVDALAELRYWEQQLGQGIKILGTDKQGGIFHIHRTRLSTSNQNWQLLTAIPQTTVIKQFDSILKNVKVTFLLWVISIVFGILVLMRFVNKKFDLFIRFMSTLSANNWKGRLPSQTIKELDQVTVTFNSLLDRLSHSMSALSMKQTELNQLNSNLESIVRHKTEELEELTIRDPLTGAYNRRFIDDLLTNTSMKNSAIALVDIDYFKAVNDGHGHNTGDEVLKEITSFFQNRLRKGDVFSRYGGEEFVIILEDIGTIDAKKVLDRYRIAFEATYFSSKKLSLHFSCGITKIGNDKDKYLNEADKALYMAKAAGRNCVVVFEPE